VARRIDVVEWLLRADHVANEEGGTVWKVIEVGRCVFLETPDRWYLGVVAERTSLTAILAAPALCVHDTGDLGLFLDGKASAKSNMEATPLPRGKEVSLALLSSAEPFPEEFFRRYCKRTHKPEGGE
jgi:hypothetical protein